MTVAAWAATSVSKVRASENESGTSLSSPRTYAPAKANPRHPAPSQTRLTSISIVHPLYCRASSATGPIVPLCPPKSEGAYHARCDESAKGPLRKCDLRERLFDDVRTEGGSLRGELVSGTG